MADELREEISVLTPQGDVKSWSVVAVGAGTERWHVKASDGHGGVWTGSGTHLFEAFCDLRTAPEAAGFRFLVAGARADSWPTQMSIQMHDGSLVATRHRPALMVIRNLFGLLFKRFAHRYVFSAAPAHEVGTVTEQEAYQKAWMRHAVRDASADDGSAGGRV